MLDAETLTALRYAVRDGQFPVVTPHDPIVDLRPWWERLLQPHNVRAFAPRFKEDMLRREIRSALLILIDEAEARLEKV